MCVAFLPEPKDAVMLTSPGLPLPPPLDPLDPLDPLEPLEPLDPEEPDEAFGQSSLTLSAFARSSHDFDSRHVSWDCVIEPAHMFVQPCSTTLAGAPHWESLLLHALVQSAVETAGSLFVPPLVPPDEPPGVASVLEPEHASTEKRIEKQPVMARVVRISKARATCIPASYITQSTLFSLRREEAPAVRRPPMGTRRSRGFSRVQTGRTPFSHDGKSLP